MPHDKWTEFAELYAAGALEAGETAEFEAHLEGRCRDCEDRVAKSREALTLLASALPPAVPSASVKAAVMDRVALEGAPVRPGAPSWAWAVAAAVSLAFTGILAVLNAQLVEMNGRVMELEGAVAAARADQARYDETLAWLHNPAVKLVRLEGAISGKPAAGTLLWNPSTCSGLFLGRGLERVPEGKAYEFWVIEKGKPLAAGTFTVDANGECAFRLPEVTMGNFDQFAVTLEAREGAVQPTGPILMAGALAVPAAS